MSKLLQDIHIQNFKSLRDVHLSSCERINLFVGKPNVGKSNLLEALALLGPDYLMGGADFGRPLLRYERIEDLFFDQNVLDEKITIECNAGIQRIHLEMSKLQNEFSYIIQKPPAQEVRISIKVNGGGHNLNPDSIFFPLKYYIFPEKQQFSPQKDSVTLQPPYGENLLSVLQSNKALRQEAADLFEPYGLELLIDMQENRISVVKRKDGILFRTPFSLVADTLRRYLFHVAAIRSNRDSVILFEEPESHNFPPYIQLLAQRILDDQSNQYFITTHSPVLFNALIEAPGKEVAVFMVDYEDFNTKVSRLSDERLREIMDYGMDIFIEHELFA